jgi:phosphoribosylformimino-5-aminoimidazole carboxamide ribotide isomerase
MNRIEIIPAIDLIAGHCVRLTQGDYTQCRTYDADPVDMAKRYADCGIHRIHIVDLDGAKVSSPQNLKTLEHIAGHVAVEIEWGGGLKSTDAIRHIFDCGADYAIIGSVVAHQPTLFAEWLTSFGGERIILGADIREGKISVNGWTESTDLDIHHCIEQFLPQKLSQAIVTDISRDGMLQGPSFNLYTELQTSYPTVDFTVSGGIATLSDIVKLQQLGLRRVIVGKAIYENHITLKELQAWLQNESYPASMSAMDER